MKKILLIDTDPDFAYLASMILKKNHFSVSVLSESDTAAENDPLKITAEITIANPDIIFLDYHFFERKLGQFCKNLRSFYKGTIVLVSEKRSLVEDCEAFFADYFLVKPFGAGSLMHFMETNKLF